MVWITGLPAAGKTTLAMAVVAALQARGCVALLIDGDRLRAGLCADLDWSSAGRRENIRRAAEMARLMAEQGQVAVCALVSPAVADRAMAREIAGSHPFIEVHVATDLAVCRARDPRGLYARAAMGALTGLTGVDGAYEVPAAPAVSWDGARPVADGVRAVLAVLNAEDR